MITPDKPRVASATPPSAGDTVLVAYYSAQGHTKTVAETIAGELGASVFVIEPADPFSEDDLNWRNDSSRVVTEYNRGAGGGIQAATVQIAVAQNMPELGKIGRAHV